MLKPASNFPEFDFPEFDLPEFDLPKFGGRKQNLENNPMHSSRR
jgi:hypothetical protein